MFQEILVSANLEANGGFLAAKSYYDHTESGC